MEMYRFVCWVSGIVFILAICVLIFLIFIDLIWFQKLVVFPEGVIESSEIVSLWSEVFSCSLYCYRIFLSSKPNFRTLMTLEISKY